MLNNIVFASQWVESLRRGHISVLVKCANARHTFDCCMSIFSHILICLHDIYGKGSMLKVDFVFSKINK